jgi:hypothetical protein
MANLQQTYSGDLTSALAGTIAKKVLDAARKEKKGPVAKAQAEMEEPDDSFPVKDIKTRELAGKILGSTVEQKLNVVEFSVKQLKNEVSALNSNLVQSHQLIYDQNLMLGAKFDQLLDHFTANRELQEEISEDNKVKRKELELEKSNDLSDTLKLSDNKSESSSGGGGNITNRVLSKILGRLTRGKFKGVKSRLKPIKSLLRPKAAAKVALKKYATKGASKFGLNLGVKGLSKGGAKIAAKKLPFGIGLAISSVFAAQRLFQNPPDPAGAALELASGAAAFVPGIGTAGSLAIDAGLAARDMSTPQYERGTGFAKSGYSMLHGMEALVTKKDSSNFSDTMMLNQDNQISYFASSVQSLANRTGTGREISSIIKKSGLDYKFTNIPFASDVGNIQQAATVKQPTEALLKDLNRRDKNIVKAVNNTSDPDDPTDPNDTTTTTTPTNTPLGPRAGYNSNGPLSYPKQNKRSVTFFGGQGADASGEHGVDFSFNDYESNYAVFAGEVTGAGKVPGSPGYGNAVQIRSVNPLNPNDTFEALYAHFPDNGMAVRVGDKVRVGDYLGKVGWNGVKGPGGGAAMQGNGAGNMSGPHTSLDFYSSNGGGWHPDASALTNAVIQMEGKVPTGYVPPIKQSAKVLPSSKHQGPVINGGGIGGDDGLTKGPKMSAADYYSLLAISSLEDDDPQGRADVAQALYNRLEGHKAGSNYFQKDNSLKSHIVAKQQFEPTFYNKSDWHKIVNMETAITAIIMSKKGRERNWTRDYAMKALMETEKSLLNPELQMKAAEHVKGRTYFLGTSEQDNMQSGDVLRNPTDNFFSMWYDENNLYGQGGVPSAASIPSRMRTESMIPPDGILADKISEPAGPKGLIESLTDTDGLSGIYMNPINKIFGDQSKLNEIERISSRMEDMEDGIPVQTVVVTNTIIKNQNNTRISSNTSKINPVKSYQLAVLGA